MSSSLRRPPRPPCLSYHDNLLWSQLLRVLTEEGRQDKSTVTRILWEAVLYCASRDLLREARNVVSCISINSAWTVKPFQPFVSPTVIPVNGTESRFLSVFHISVWASLRLDIKHVIWTPAIMCMRKQCSLDTVFSFLLSFVTLGMFSPISSCFIAYIKSKT